MAKKKEREFVTIKDIVIKSGTVFTDEGNGNGEYVIGFHKDSVGFLKISHEELLELRPDLLVELKR